MVLQSQVPQVVPAVIPELCWEITGQLEKQSGLGRKKLREKSNKGFGELVRRD